MTSTYDKDNIFAKILRGEITSYKIFETPHSLAILDAFPACPGHSLLIPKYEAATIQDLGVADSDHLGNVMKDLARLTALVQKATNAEATNVVVNNGPASGQLVPHVHFHVLPRNKGDQLIQHPKPYKGKLEDGDKVLEAFQAASHLPSL